MSRSSQADAARNRAQVIEATSHLLRERGAAGVSVQDAMSAAGLTHGGFYKHFASKDELLATAARTAFDDILERLERITRESAAPADARERIISEYLTPQHRDTPATGCANTALAADAARSESIELRGAYVSGFEQTLQRLEALTEGPDARRRALQDLLVLVGGLTLARATSGSAVSDEILVEAERLLHPRAGDAPRS